MRGIVLGAAALAALGAAGCMTAGAARGPVAVPVAGYEYHGGRGAQGFTAEPAQVQEAAAAAMDDLGITAIRKERDPLGLTLTGSTVDHRTASVTVQPTSGGPTVVAARVGWFGDEATTRALMDRIGIRLGTLPPAPIQAESSSEPAPKPRFSHTLDPDVIRDRFDTGYRDDPVSNP
jgi:hypothetical protein